jgi:hypothetical protein
MDLDPSNRIRNQFSLKYEPSIKALNSIQEISHLRKKYKEIKHTFSMVKH